MNFAQPTSFRCSIAVAAVCLSFAPLVAQGTLADYQRAHDLRAKSADLVVNTPGSVTRTTSGIRNQ